MLEECFHMFYVYIIEQLRIATAFCLCVHYYNIVAIYVAPHYHHHQNANSQTHKRPYNNAITSEYNNEMRMYTHFGHICFITWKALCIE